MIKDSFGLYVVMSKYCTVLGVYQTFGQALNRISECLETSRLVEEFMHGSHIRYYSESDHKKYADVYYTSFFYHDEFPKVSAGMVDPFKDKPNFKHAIVNK